MFFSRSYSPPAGKGEGEKILFIRYSALGDILLATPYARALKEKYPKCLLTWLAARPYDRILEGQPYIDRDVQWDRGQDNTAFFRLIGEIRKNRYTRIVSLHNSDRSGIIVLFSGVPQRYCRSDRWRAVYNSGNESFWKIHDIPVPETAGKGFVATEKMLESASAVLEPLKPPFVLAAIGASKEVKQWPVRNWVEFAKKACRRGIPVVLAGDGADELAKAEEICSVVSGALLYNLVGRIPLSILGGVVKNSALVIAGDTGILNLARILGVPSMALLGSTRLPRSIGLMEPERVFIAECGDVGCGKDHCRKRCLGSIESEDVFQSVVSFWERYISQ